MTEDPLPLCHGKRGLNTAAIQILRWALGVSSRGTNLLTAYTTAPDRELRARPLHLSACL